MKNKTPRFRFNPKKDEMCQWRNLAPRLYRQRLIIEGTTKEIVKPEQIKSYLEDIAQVTQMEVVSGPFAYSAHEMGFGGWVHWKSSGAHFYSYPTKPSLFTVDIYTCKKFNNNDVLEFTRYYFTPLELVWKEVKV